MRNFVLAAFLAWAAAPGRTATRFNVAQLQSFVASARSAGEPDVRIYGELADVELTERWDAPEIPDEVGFLTTERLRIIAARSVFAGPAAGAMVPDPPPPPADRDAILARARRYTQNYIHDLPNFICTRSTTQYDDAAHRYLESRGATSTELVYVRGHESDEPQILDRPACRDIPDGLSSYGEFGSILAALFADNDPAGMTWSHWETIGGRRTAVFAYTLGRKHSHYAITWCCWISRHEYQPRQTNTAYHGEIFMDARTGEVLRLTRKAAPPFGFPTIAADTMVQYAPVGIGGKSYLCPVRSIVVSKAKTAQIWPKVIYYLNDTTFTNYRKFVTDTALRWLPANTRVPAAADPAHPALPVSALPIKQSRPDCQVQVAAALPQKDLPPVAAPSQVQPAGTAPEAERFRRLRFSPDGRYLLGQDETGVDVFGFHPFRVLFRIPAANASRAEFTPDASQIIFISGGTHATASQVAFVSAKPRVERWNVADRKRVESTAIPLDACEVLQLSPEGRYAACIAFDGVLRLVAVASGETLFEKKAGPPLTRRNAAESQGNATIDFSPDARFAIFKPKIEHAIPIVWDLRHRKEIALKNHLKQIRWAAYIFAGPDRLVMTYHHYGLARNDRITELVSFPSGQLIQKLPLRNGRLSRSADPHFVLARPPSAGGTRFPIQAFDLHTGAAVTDAAPVLDVFAEHYVAERPDGALEVYETGMVGRQLHEPVHVSGEVIARDNGRFVVRTNDYREVTLLVADDTDFAEGASFKDIQPGRFVDTESRETGDEELHATFVRLRDAAPPAANPPAADTLPTPMTDAQRAFLAAALALASSQGVAPPDYTCHRRAARYRSDLHTDTFWQLAGAVSGDSVRQAGHPADYDAVLADVAGLSDSGQVEYGHAARLGEHDAVSYTYRLDPPHSHWTVRQGGQTVRPWRTGTIWFDRQTKRLLRIESRASWIPPEFPLDTASVALDYDYVPLRGGLYLVPTHAEQSACWRETTSCTRYSVDFTDYRPLGN
ncbi:MAG TPA: hypothetical protein VMI94_14790 [Bryobacteraceae bacterium]|nr:hypothetical protein [Bryobacteraceae bacterium]